MPSAAHGTETSANYAMRVLYREALNDLRAGDRAAFRAKQRALGNYVLAPYLEYHALNRSLTDTRARDLNRFLNEHAQIPAGRILKRRWLRAQGRSRRWQTLLEHYPDEDAGLGDELRCYHLRARYNTGERAAALAATTPLWTMPRSMPKACDPLFDVYRNSSYFDEEVAWDRLAAALGENEVTLARYLLRYFDRYESAAQAFYDVHTRPQRLAGARAYPNVPEAQAEKYRQLVSHGLLRLARRDPEDAYTAWSRYQRRLNYSDHERTQIERRLLVARAKEGRFPSAVEQTPLTASDDIADVMLHAVKHRAWDTLIEWYGRLPESVQAQPRWRYWLARAKAETDAPVEEVGAIYRGLRDLRQYYGFWAAQRLGETGSLGAPTAKVNRLRVNQLKSDPQITRSLELFAVGDEINARREWYAALSRMDNPTRLQAAELAQDTGLLSLAIRTANQAEALDAIHLRFPVAFSPQFGQASLKTSLPAPLLRAIARQESAYDYDARSHANARGLMQLLPSTAKLVARRHGLSNPTTGDLYDPGTNITLGSHHLAWLGERYDGQSALMFAAYNAGEHRVDRWIKDADGVALDVWIERIPFRETRNYVKNVLAFRHVYSIMSGAALPFVSLDELTVTVP